VFVGTISPGSNNFQFQRSVQQKASKKPTGRSGSYINNTSDEGKDYVREQGDQKVHIKTNRELSVKPPLVIKHLVEEVDGYEIHALNKMVVYVVLKPFNLFLMVSKDTGDIEMDLLSIPFPFRKILKFDPQSFNNDKHTYFLHEVSYWMVNEGKSLYITAGEICKLHEAVVKN